MRVAPLIAVAVLASGCADDGPREHLALARPAPEEFPCVHFEDLRRYLPRALEGYQPVREEGSSGRYGEVSISEAERVFSGDDGREVSVRIVDTTLSEDVARAIRAAARAGPAPLIGQGAVGFVRFDQDEQKAEANLLVADRFVVAVTARGFDGTQEVRRIAGALELGGLAALR